MNAKHALVAAIAIALLGCGAKRAPADPAQSKYDAAVALERDGKWSEAADGYDAAANGAADSPIVAEAKRRAPLLRLRAARDAMDAGDFAKAKALAEKSATDDAKALLASAEFVDGAKVADAIAKQDFAALGAIDKGSPAYAKAHAFVANGEAARMLAAVKAACVSKSPPASCWEASRSLRLAWPDAPETKDGEAARIAEEKRINTWRWSAEANLVDYADVAQDQIKVDRCVTEATGQTNAGDPSAADTCHANDDDIKAREKPIRAALDYAEQMIADPHWIKHYEDAYTRVRNEGFYEKDFWESP